MSFRAPEQTGISGSFDRRYQLDAHNSTPAAGCVSTLSVAVPPSNAHARVKIKLDPRHLGGRWCRGAYRGKVDETQGPSCAKGKFCPEFATVLRTIGRFSFRVKRASGADATPPTFAGLKSATACTPGPQQAGQKTPYTLTWDAASDHVTPSAKIVYDVFMSRSAGGEDFANPNWSTAPGVTSFRTPGLLSHGNVYFVVRARDTAGNEDHNRVERRGFDPCV